jgi:hypothetical protein
VAFLKRPIGRKKKERHQCRCVAVLLPAIGGVFLSNAVVLHTHIGFFEVASNESTNFPIMPVQNVSISVGLGFDDNGHGI